MPSYKIKTSKGIKGPYSKRVILQGIESGKIHAKAKLYDVDAGEWFDACDFDLRARQKPVHRETSIPTKLVNKRQKEIVDEGLSKLTNASNPRTVQKLWQLGFLVLLGAIVVGSLTPSTPRNKVEEPHWKEPREAQSPHKGPKAPYRPHKPGDEWIWVNGYHRKDGTYVNGHWRRKAR